MKKTVLVAAACLILAAVVVFATWPLWHTQVDGVWYASKAETLDLLDKEISLDHYQKLREAFPDSKILWNVPFQGGTLPSDARGIELARLTEEEAVFLDHLTELETVDARDCRDYGALMVLQQRHPDCKVLYQVQVDGTRYDQSAAEVTLSSLTEEDLALLAYLPALKTVDARDCRDYDLLLRLREICPGAEILTTVEIDGQEYAPDTKEITLEQVSLDGLQERLVWMTGLEKLTLLEPAGDPEGLKELMQALPGTEVYWEVEVAGVRLNSTMTELDISAGKGLSPEIVREAVAWMPDAEKIFLGDCGIDNEVLAQLREELRGECKVVWTVSLGWIKIPSDSDNFGPVQYEYYLFSDEDAYNLRYCEDMVALDLGHMNLHDLAFLEFMPKLRFLILAHSTVLDFSPLQYCTSLEFLELDWGYFYDYSLLLNCRNLRDLNIGKQWGDPAPLYQMTWLENLWCVNCAPDFQAALKANMPDTVRVNTAGSITVGNGWRNLPRYYEMRDYLGMPYLGG